MILVGDGIKHALLELTWTEHAECIIKVVVSDICESGDGLEMHLLVGTQDHEEETEMRDSNLVWCEINVKQVCVLCVLPWHHGTFDTLPRLPLL